MDEEKTREWLKRRRELRYYTNIVQELQLEDTNGFKEMMRMDYKYFKEILNLVEPDITPQEIIGGNKVISAAERLTLTLRFLATGETFQSMSFQFRISDRTISVKLTTFFIQHVGKGGGGDVAK